MRLVGVPTTKLPDNLRSIPVLPDRSVVHCCERALQTRYPFSPMLDSEEIRWVKSTANELNNLLQVISESSQVLENLVPGATRFR